VLVVQVAVALAAPALQVSVTAPLVPQFAMTLPLLVNVTVSLPLPRAKFPLVGATVAVNATEPFTAEGFVPAVSVTAVVVFALLTV
jgi:hypothetical protein